mmetsp:Transcript_27316/g.62938  ORF Transcript_27316/g.62938 Transcript_27316/m.62938 type:complete len:1084 (-) Transcript_27316:119-3370(-)
MEDVDDLQLQFKKFEAQLDKLVRGQARIELGIERLREERPMQATLTGTDRNDGTEREVASSMAIPPDLPIATPSNRGMTPASRWSQGFHASTSDVSNFPMDIDDADGGGSDSFAKLSARNSSAELFSPSMRMGGAPAKGNFKPYDGWCMARTRSRPGAVKQMPSEALLRLQAITWSESKGIFPFHPTSWTRILFDILGFAVLLYDASVVPYFLAWDVPIAGAMWYISVVAVSFWVVDLLLNLVTGYIQDGQLVMSHKAVALNYLKGGFTLDLALILMESIGLIFAQFADDTVSGSEILILRSARLAKISRAVRIMAKLRTGLLLKSEQVMTVLVMFTGLSSQVQVVQFLSFACKLMLFITWLHHAGSCLWYWLQTTLVSDTGTSWLQQLHQDGVRGERDVYLHGVYWSVTAMFSGACVVPPTNTFEAIFAELYIVSSGLFVTLIGSSLAAKLIQSQLQHQERTKRYRLLNEYLRQHKVDPLLAIAVRAQFRDRMGEKRMLSEMDMPFLSVLSAQLRSELRFARCGKFLTPNSLLRACEMGELGTLREICFFATSQVIVAVGEEVFSSRMVMEHSFYVMQGHLNYVPDNMAGNSEVSEGHAVAENALFLKWRSLGTLSTHQEATRPCEILKVGTEAFLNVFRGKDDLHSLAQGFAFKLAEALRFKDPNELTDLDPGVDYDEVLAMTAKEGRMSISLEAQQAFLERGGVAPWSVKMACMGITHSEDWHTAIEEGQAFIHKGIGGEIYGVARVVTLRLRAKGGYCCVLLGTWRSTGKHTVALSLPSRVFGEDIGYEANMQLLMDELGSLGKRAVLEEACLWSRVEETVKNELHVPMATKLIRTIQECEVDVGSPHGRPPSMGESQGRQVSKPNASAPPAWLHQRSVRSMDPTNPDHLVWGHARSRKTHSSESDGSVSQEPGTPIMSPVLTPGTAAPSFENSTSSRSYSRLRKAASRRRGERACGAFLLQGINGQNPAAIHIYGWVPESDLQEKSDSLCSVPVANQVWADVAHWLQHLQFHDLRELPVLAMPITPREVQLADPPFNSVGATGASMPSPMTFDIDSPVFREDDEVSQPPPYDPGELYV